MSNGGFESDTYAQNTQVFSNYAPTQGYITQEDGSAGLFEGERMMDGYIKSTSKGNILMNTMDNGVTPQFIDIAK